jgi:type VI protein secretion system component VasF
MTESVSVEDYEKLKKSVEFVINRRKEVDAENLANKEKMKKERRDLIKNLPYWFSVGVMILSLGIMFGIAIAKI